MEWTECEDIEKLKDFNKKLSDYITEFINLRHHNFKSGLELKEKHSIQIRADIDDIIYKLRTMKRSVDKRINDELNKE